MWVSECFDPLDSSAPGLAVGRSASPCDIFIELLTDCRKQDRRSPLVKRYRKKFRALAKEWRAHDRIGRSDYDEILGLMQHGFNIWMPLLYVIPRAPIEEAGRLQLVPAAKRATPGVEYRIFDLMPHEFDIIRRVPR